MLHIGNELGGVIRPPDFDSSRTQVVDFIEFTF